MIQTGIVTGSTYEKNRDGSRDVLMLQVQLTSKDDVQSVEFMQGANDTFHPGVGVKVLVIQNGSAYKIAIACDDKSLMQVEAGERAIASVVNAEVKSSVKCKNNGEVVLNEGIDFAVEFTKLKLVVDALVLQLAAHVHPYAGGTTLVSATPFSADITPAKVEKVRL